MKIDGIHLSNHKRFKANNNKWYFCFSYVVFLWDDDLPSHNSEETESAGVSYNCCFNIPQPQYVESRYIFNPTSHTVLVITDILSIYTQMAGNPHMQLASI